MDRPMQQRRERHVYADLICTQEVALGKTGRIADVQITDGHAGARKEAGVNWAKCYFSSGLFRDGVGDRVPVSIDVQEIRHGQHKQDQHQTNNHKNFCPKGEAAGFRGGGRSCRHGNSHSPGRVDRNLGPGARRGPYRGKSLSQRQGVSGTDFSLSVF